MRQINNATDCLNFIIIPGFNYFINNFAENFLIKAGLISIGDRRGKELEEEIKEDIEKLLDHHQEFLDSIKNEPQFSYSNPINRKTAAEYLTDPRSLKELFASLSTTTNDRQPIISDRQEVENRCRAKEQFVQHGGTKAPADPVRQRAESIDLAYNILEFKKGVPVGTGTLNPQSHRFEFAFFLQILAYLKVNFNRPKGMAERGPLGPYAASYEERTLKESARHFGFCEELAQFLPQLSLRMIKTFGPLYDGPFYDRTITSRPRYSFRQKSSHCPWCGHYFHFGDIKFIDHFGEIHRLPRWQRIWSRLWPWWAPPRSLSVRQRDGSLANLDDKFCPYCTSEFQCALPQGFFLYPYIEICVLGHSWETQFWLKSMCNSSQGLRIPLSFSPIDECTRNWLREQRLSNLSGDWMVLWEVIFSANSFRNQRNILLGVKYSSRLHQCVFRYHNMKFGIVLMVDPFQVDSLRETLSKELTIDPQELLFYESPHPHFILNRFLHNFQMGEIPIAIVIANYHILIKGGMLPDSAWQAPQHETNLIIREFLNRHLNGLVQTIEANFRSYAYFGVDVPTVTGVDDYRSAPQAIWRIEEPLLWLFSNLGILPDKSSKLSVYGSG